MGAWWEALTTLERAFAYCAIPASILLVVQTVLLLFGIIAQGDGDASAPDGLDGMEDADISIAADGGYDIDVDHDGVPDFHTHDLGGESSGDHDAGFDGGLRLLTVRGLIAFFAVGGWTGLAMLRGGINTVLSSAVALGAGLLAMVVLAWLLKLALKLQSDGAADIRNAIGKTGSVYLTIPAARSERGKVMVMLQERLTELEAVTDAAEPIKTGLEVRVLSIAHGNTLVVELAQNASSKA